MQLRLFAPFLPFVTDEVWSWWQEGSIHRAPWPTVTELATGGDPQVIDDMATVLSAVRRAKSEAKVSMKAEVTRVGITAPEGSLSRLRLAESDLVAAGRIAEVTYLEGTELTVDVTLA